MLLAYITYFILTFTPNLHSAATPIAHISSKINPKSFISITQEYSNLPENISKAVTILSPGSETKFQVIFLAYADKEVRKKFAQSIKTKRKSPLTLDLLINKFCDYLSTDELKSYEKISFLLALFSFQHTGFTGALSNNHHTTLIGSSSKLCPLPHKNPMQLISVDQKNLKTDVFSEKPNIHKLLERSAVDAKAADSYKELWNAHLKKTGHIGIHIHTNFVKQALETRDEVCSIL